MTGLLVTGAAAPQQAQAGDKGWSTAGKILTGIVIGGILADHCVARPVARETVYYSGPVCPPRPAVHWRHHETRVVLPPPPPPPPVIVTRVYEVTRVVQVEPPREEPVIRYQDDGSRLFQPPIRGHTAYLQVWSEVNREWVSIKEYPSIW